MENESEGTSFVQWRERAQSEVRQDRPHLRPAVIVGLIIVVLVLAVGAFVLLS